MKSYALYRLLAVAAGVLLLPAASSAGGKKPDVRMLVDYGDSKQRTRISHDGEIDPLVVRTNQVVTIQLNFPSQYGGAPLVIAPIDGGKIDLQKPVTLPPNGKITFTFQADESPGLCHLLVTSVEQYHIPVFVVPANGTPSAH